MRLALERLSRSPASAAIAAGLDALLAHTPGAPAVADLDAVLAARAGVRFEPQPPRGRPRRGAPVDLEARYDGAIATRGVVPTREGSLHDVLNALVWAAMPATKRAVHLRQHVVALAHVPASATRLPNARPRQADVLAMLDEGGLVLSVERTAEREVLEGALATGEPEVVAARVRALGARVVVLGHAVLEHLAEDRDGDPRAAAYVVARGAGGDGPCAGAALVALDRALAARVADPHEMLTPPPWPAVPVRALFARLAGARGEVRT